METLVTFMYGIFLLLFIKMQFSSCEISDSEISGRSKSNRKNQSQWCMDRVNPAHVPVCVLKMPDCDTYQGEKDVLGESDEIKCFSKNVFAIEKRKIDCWNLEDKLIVRCTAPFPIDVDFSGQVFSRDFTPKFSKTLAPTNNGIIISSFNVVFDVKKLPTWNGRYQIQNLKNRTRYTNLYFIMSGSSGLPPHLLEGPIGKKNEVFNENDPDKVKFSNSSRLDFVPESRMTRFCFPENQTGFAVDIFTLSPTHSRHISRCIYQEKSCWNYHDDMKNTLSFMQWESTKDGKSQLSWTTAHGCSEVYNKFDHGLFIRSSSLENQYTEYFYGLDNMPYTDANTAPAEALIQVSSSDTAMHPNQSYAFSCNVLDYALVHPILWYSKFKNGTYKEEKISQVVDNCPCYDMVNITPETEEVICAASFWNSNQWVTSGTKINFFTN